MQRFTNDRKLPSAYVRTDNVVYGFYTFAGRGSSEYSFTPIRAFRPQRVCVVDCEGLVTSIRCGLHEQLEGPVMASLFSLDKSFKYADILRFLHKGETFGELSFIYDLHGRIVPRAFKIGQLVSTRTVEPHTAFTLKATAPMGALFIIGDQVQ